MLIESLLIALVVGKIWGGKLSRLGQLTLSEPWLVPVALIIQSGLYWAAAREVGVGSEWVSLLLSVSSYCLLLLFTYRNRACPGMRWIALGILLNTLVIAVNGGVMPVDPRLLPEESRKALLNGQGTHGLMTSMTYLPVLADRFYINILGLKQMFSLGDILIDIGVFFLILRTVLSQQKNKLKTTSW